MLNVLELLEMRRDVVTGFLFIGLVYSINYFVKNKIILNIDENENADENKIYLNELDNNTDNNTDNNMDYSKAELQNKKEYLMNLNDKLMDIKHMLQDIKDKLNNK